MNFLVCVAQTKGKCYSRHMQRWMDSQANYRPSEREAGKDWIAYIPVSLALVIMCVRLPPAGLVGWLNNLGGGIIPMGRIICGGLGMLSLGMCVRRELRAGVILSAIVVGIAVAGLFFPVSF